MSYYCKHFYKYQLYRYTGGLRQKDYKFKASLTYRVRPFLKKTNKQTNKQKNYSHKETMANCLRPPHVNQTNINPPLPYS